MQNSESHDEHVCDSLDLLEDKYHERETVYGIVISRGMILEIYCCRDRMADGRKVFRQARLSGQIYEEACI